MLEELPSLAARNVVNIVRPHGLPPRLSCLNDATSRTECLHCVPTTTWQRSSKSSSLKLPDGQFPKIVLYLCATQPDCASLSGCG